MFVVTAVDANTGARSGCLVGFVTQCSLDPMRFLVCLARAVVKNGFKILADAVPFGGALYDVAADASSQSCAEPVYRWRRHLLFRAGTH